MRRKIQNKKKTNIRKAEIEKTNFDYYAPTKVVFGKGTEDQAGDLVREQGATKVLVHYGSGSVKRRIFFTSGPSSIFIWCERRRFSFTVF